MDGCEGCRDGMRKVRERQKDAMKQWGWYVHAVPGWEYPDGYANFHTHGILESFGHKDFQIVMPIDMKCAHQIFQIIVDKLKKGAKYEDGQEVKEIADLPLRFIDALECDRPVLRVIFPDMHGKFPGDEGAQKEFDDQARVRIEGETNPEDN